MRERGRAARPSVPIDGTHRVVEAFTTLPLSDLERRVVQALLDFPGQTSEALTKSLGWKRLAWHMHFGKVCSRRRGRLWQGPFETKRNKEFYYGILAAFDDQTRGFTMKPAVVDGFLAIGLTAAKWQ